MVHGMPRYRLICVGDRTKGHIRSFWHGKLPAPPSSLPGGRLARHPHAPITRSTCAARRPILRCSRPTLPRRSALLPAPPDRRRIRLWRAPADGHWSLQRDRGPIAPPHRNAATLLQTQRLRYSSGEQSRQRPDRNGQRRRGWHRGCAHDRRPTAVVTGIPFASAVHPGWSWLCPPVRRRHQTCPEPVRPTNREAPRYQRPCLPATWHPVPAVQPRLRPGRHRRNAHRVVRSRHGADGRWRPLRPSMRPAPPPPPPLHHPGQGAGPPPGWIAGTARYCPPHCGRGSGRLSPQALIPSQR